MVVVKAVEVLETHQSPVERVGKFHYLQTFAGDVCKGRHQKGQPCKAVEAVCRKCSIKGHYGKVYMKGKCSTHLVNVPEASTSSTSDPDNYDEHRDLPVYAHMVNVQDNKCNHLI